VQTTTNTRLWASKHDCNAGSRHKTIVKGVMIACQSRKRDLASTKPIGWTMSSIMQISQHQNAFAR